MPERKGRKRKHPHERSRGRDAAGAIAAADHEPPRARPAPEAPAGRRAAASDGPLPSTTARVTGLLLAVVTAFLSVLMVYQAASGDASGIDAVMRVVGGVLLLGLAAVVGVLSVAPAMVRDWFRRKR